MPPTSQPAEGPPAIARLVPLVRKVAESPEMLSIGRALPISFAGLALGLVVFMAADSGSLLQRFSLSFGAAFGVMSAVLVVLLAFDLARRRGVPPFAAAAVAAGAFALSLPYREAHSLEPLAKALGSSGLFLAIGISLITVAALRGGRSVFGKRLGYLAAAVAVLGLAAALAVLGISLTAALTRAIAPLGMLGDSLTALLILTFVETLLWTVGIHGPALLAAVVLPVYIHLQVQNSEALAHNEPLPHIVTVSTFLFVFPGGAGATFPLVLLLLRNKVKRVRNVAFATLLPSIANANEPLMFGLPLVLNPVLGVPFVITPLVLAVVSWFAISLGFVSRPAYYIPSTVPLPLGVFLATRDWRSVLLVLANVALGAAIYLPFVRAYERGELRREREAAAA